MLVSVVQFCWFQMLWKNWVPRYVELFTCIYLLIKKRKKRGFEMGLVWIFKVRKQNVRFLGNRRDREGLLLSALDRHRDRLWLCYCYQINIAVNSVLLYSHQSYFLLPITLPIAFFSNNICSSNQEIYFNPSPNKYDKIGINIRSFRWTIFSFFPLKNRTFISYCDIHLIYFFLAHL